jgi:hypothetical protein
MSLVPFVDTPDNMTVTRLAHDGIDVKSTVVPDTVIAVAATILAVAVYVDPSVLNGTCPTTVGDATVGAVLAHVVPLLVKTFLFVPGAINCTALPPLPRRTELAVSVDRPVPPLAAPSGVVKLTMLPLVMDPP